MKPRADSRSFGLCAIALLIAAACSLPAQAAPPKLTALDYFQIYQLYARYSWSLDSGNGAARTATFTTDGTFNSNMSTPSGSHSRLGLGFSRGVQSTSTGDKTMYALATRFKTISGCAKADDTINISGGKA